MFIAKVYEYEVWGNENGGFDVNNVFCIGTVQLNGDYRKLSDKQILRRLHGKAGNNVWPSGHIVLSFDQRKIAVDNGYCDENIIHLTDRRGVRPYGHIELMEEVIE